MHDECVAIIDLGSNSARLIVMKAFPDHSYQMIQELREAVRLADHLDDESGIRPEGIDRAIEVAMAFARCCRAHRAREIYAVATGAMRIARNGPEVARRIEEESGLVFDIISGEQEAHYGYLGAINALPVENGVVVDLGGGTAELVRVVGRRALHSTSLPLGAVTLTRSFLDRDRSSGEQIAALEAHLAESFGRIPWLGRGETKPVLVGLGGTARNIGKIHRRRVNYPLAVLHGLAIPSKAMAGIYKDMRRMSIAERRDVPGLSPGRADIIVAGLALYHVLAGVMGAGEMMISGRGLRDGLFYSRRLQGELPGARLPDPALAATRNIMHQYAVRQEHAYHVASLACSLFDQVASLHGLGARERRLLEIAALLHDVGIVVSYYNHHEHGLYILTHQGIDGLSHAELAMVAYVVAGHEARCAPWKEWPQLRELLSPADLAALPALALMLRLCECLDETEAGAARSLSTQVGPSRSGARIVARGLPDGSFELTEARKVLPDLEKALGAPLALVGEVSIERPCAAPGVR
jgi:exopolyphosphatase/guanosine-5'-triphosphate,3'-diphosphate pyrophosphatase